MATVVTAMFFSACSRGSADDQVDPEAWMTARLREDAVDPLMRIPPEDILDDLCYQFEYWVIFDVHRDQRTDLRWQIDNYYLYHSFPKTSGTLDLMRIVVGAVMGGLTCGLILLTIKKAATVGPTSASGPQAPGASGVIPCVLCGKKLRVPRSAAELWITCPGCSHKFTYRNREASNSSSA